jgi:hypothetical protein
MPQAEPTPVVDPLAIPRPHHMQDGQPYWRIGRRPHTRRDGTATALDVWQSFCATCGEPFEQTTPAATPSRSMIRRCQEHVSPGRKVGGKADRRRVRPGEVLFGADAPKAPPETPEGEETP